MSTRRRILAGLGLAAAIGVGGCGASAKTKAVTPPTASYPAAVQAAFLHGCERFGGNATDCGCALHQAQATIPLTQIGRDELELKYGTPNERVDTQLGRIIGHCAGQQAVEEIHRQESG